MPRALDFLRTGRSFDHEQLAAIGAAFELLGAALRRANIRCYDDVIAAEMMKIASAGACDARWLSVETLKVLARDRRFVIVQTAMEQADHPVARSPLSMRPSARVAKRA